LNVPRQIRAGDVVDITITIGSASFLTGAFEPVPTPAPFEQDLVSNFSFSDGGEFDFGGVEFLTPVPSATPVDPIDLPVAKTLVSGATILQVNYEREFNPAASTDPDQSVFINGELESIVVSIPRELQEVLSWSINNGLLTVTVRNPNDPAPDDLYLPGYSYDDNVAFFKASLFFWSLTPHPETDPLLPGGASVLVPTLLATYQPSATPAPQFGTPAP
jgi:hypothetical protein